MASYYPSTAELAAFRRSITRHTHYFDSALAHPTDGAAWPDERQHGIGYREDGRWPLVSVDPTAKARREAAANRPVKATR